MHHMLSHVVKMSWHTPFLRHHSCISKHTDDFVTLRNIDVPMDSCQFLRQKLVDAQDSRGVLREQDAVEHCNTACTSLQQKQR